MEIFITILLFIVGLVLIIKGGDIFVDAATWIAEKSGIPKFIVGATIVSIATTLPELIASIMGTMAGSLGLAVGNAIGSVTANTAMIMAISIIFMPAVVDRKQYAFKSILLMVVTLTLGLLLLNGHGDLNIWESIVVLIFAVVFFTENVLKAKEASKLQNQLNELDKNNPEAEVEEEKKEGKNTFLNTLKVMFCFNGDEDLMSNTTDLIVNIIKFVIGAAGIFFGARLLVDKGTLIAQMLGVSDAVIGLTIVAIGTSLPELVTTLTSIAKKQSSLSVGNIVGANIIDMSVILPICAFVSGGKLVLDTMQTVYLDIPVSLAVMIIAFVPALITKKFSRWQGFVMLGIYIAYLVVVCTGCLGF